MSPRIEPTIENLREYLVYEPETGIVRWRKKKGTLAQGQEAGCIGNRGYRKIHFSGKDLNGHRVAWALHFGEWPAFSIDHINLNKSDNRLVNLRLATPGQQMANTRPRGKLPKGCSYDPRKRKYRAHIQKDGVRISLGRHRTIEAAAAAYVEAAIKLYGEFARFE